MASKLGFQAKLRLTMPNYFIAIAGNMGVGKSTLTERLATKLGWQAYLEPAADNPYLSDFYEDMHRWGFHSQMFFLAHRFKQHSELAQAGFSVIQDRSVYENAEVFAHNLYLRGFLSERDWQTYQTMYQTLIALLPPPNLIIYLRANVPTLLRRISRRGRDFEQKADPEYVAELNRLHEDWAANFTLAPMLRVNTDYVNFVEDDAALEKLCNSIVRTLPLQQLPFKKTAHLVGGAVR